MRVGIWVRENARAKEGRSIEKRSDKKWETMWGIGQDAKVILVEKWIMAEVNQVVAYYRRWSISHDGHVISHFPAHLEVRWGNDGVDSV